MTIKKIKEHINRQKRRFNEHDNCGTEQSTRDGLWVFADQGLDGFVFGGCGQ
jgi:hypothetical protein